MNTIINVSIIDVVINAYFISNSTHDGFSLNISLGNDSSPIFYEAIVSYVMSSKEIVSFEAHPRSSEGKWRK